MDDMIVGKQVVNYDTTAGLPQWKADLIEQIRRMQVTVELYGAIAASLAYLCDANGVDYRSEMGPPPPHQTWEDFIEAGRQIALKYM